MNKLEKKILLLEEKLNDVKSQNNELNINIEELYDTINDIKFPDTDKKNITRNNKTSGNRQTPILKRSNRKRKNINYSELDDDPELIDIDEGNITDPDYNIDLDKQQQLQQQQQLEKINDTNNNKYNTKFIDDLISKIPSPEPYIKFQALSFHKNLILNQPQLDTNEIAKHIIFFLNQPNTIREEQINQFNNIINLNDETIPKLFKIINSSLDTYYKKIALNKLKILESMKPEDNEYFKLSQWIDNFLDIPFNIFQKPKYTDETIISKPADYLQNSRTHLDTIIYGQKHTKEHIIQILAKMITNPKTLGSVFAIYGEAGTGKTTLIKNGLSYIFGLPFVFISLGGAQDRSFLTGSNYVYEGSSCGKILQALKQAKCMNPIFYFDELDKISMTDKGNDIMNLLIHLTDYTQNSHFIDEYMDGISVDLSKATFIFSFNNPKLVSPILLDRMEIIKFRSYSVEQKMHIARNYLLPNIVKNIFGNISLLYNFIIPDNILYKIVSPDILTSGNNYKHITNKKIKINNKLTMKKKIIENKLPGGVRYINKKLENILSKINVEMISGNKITYKDINKNYNNLQNKIDIIIKL